MILVRTPFRLPLGGGGTDLPAYYSRFGGRLVTAAINKYMFISLNEPALSDEIKIRYSKVEILPVGKFEDIRHDIVRATLKFFDYRRPIEINSMADLGAGTGMGSSGSYAVGLLHGLNTMLRNSLSVQELAEQACDIEINWAGKPVGKQDQYAAAFGGMITMGISKGGEVEVDPIILECETVTQLEHSLLMFYTNIQRDASEILRDQSQRVKISGDRATEALHRIKEIGVEIAGALMNGDIERFGRLMNEHWMAKRGSSDKMSTSFVDECYQAAMGAGAFGGKIMGAGGGGFLLVCVPPEKRREIRRVLEAKGLVFMPFRFDWEGSKVLANV